MHTLLASRPNVVASTRLDALGVNGALRMAEFAGRFEGQLKPPNADATAIFSLLISAKMCF